MNSCNQWRRVVFLLGGAENLGVKTHNLKITSLFQNYYPYSHENVYTSFRQLRFYKEKKLSRYVK